MLLCMPFTNDGNTNEQTDIKTDSSLSLSSPINPPPPKKKNNSVGGMTNLINS